jgi:hypothetical protein
MFKLAVTLFSAAVLAILGWTTYQAVYAFSLSNSSDRTNHLFLVAAYTVTWLLQLGYLAYMGARWRAQNTPEKRNR